MQHQSCKTASPPRLKGREHTRTYEVPTLENTPLNPHRCNLVLHLILKKHNWRHSTKDKGVSHKTKAERARFCLWLFDFLLHHPRHFKLDPRTFSGRHVKAVTEHWQAEAKAGQMSPATIQTYFSFMKTFTGWIDKPKLMKSIDAYFDDKQLYRRSLANGADKSWRAQGIEVEAVIAEVESYDRYAAASLRLMQAFHLRFKESLMLRPHADVLTAAQARMPETGPAFYLDTHRGTKGGRKRMIPIDSPARVAAIDFARRVAVGKQDSVSDPRLDLPQALRRLRYVMERHGITRKALGVTPHGLRHQGAAEDYEAMTGERPPVAGEKAVNPAIDHLARQAIAASLGHGRTQITNAYLGGQCVRKASTPSLQPVLGQSFPADPVVHRQAYSPKK